MATSRKSEVEGRRPEHERVEQRSGFRSSIFDLRLSASALRRAFTLIELMVVVGVMALLMTISLPSIYHLMHPESMRTSVEKLMEACGEARARAILQGVTTELRIRQVENEISVVSIGSLIPESAGPLFDAEGVPIQRKPPSGPSIFKWKFPETIMMKPIFVNGEDWTESEEAAVRFYPDGTSDEMSIVLSSLSSRDAQPRNVWLEVVTGLPDVETDLNKFRER